MKKKSTGVAIALLGLALSLAGCSKKDSGPAANAASARKSLAQLLTLYPNFTAFGVDKVLVYFNTPTNDNIIFARDFGANNAHPEANSFFKDVTLEMNLSYFTDAGMDPLGIMDMEGWDYTVNGDKAYFIYELGAQAFNPPGAKADADPVEALLAVFDELVRTQPDRLLNDMKRGMWGIDLGGGNSVLWAKNPAKTKKDLIISLNPEPFVKAGADPKKITSFDLVTITAKDKDGKAEEVQRLEQSSDIR